MTSGPLWITEREVTRLVSLKDGLAALERGLRWEGAGKAENIPKSLGRWSNGAMHCLGAMFPDEGFVGWKTWAATEKGGAVTFELFDANNGGLLAIIEAKAMGQLRTACMTAIGTDWLAAEDAATLALIGTGRYSLLQLAAIAAVRPLTRVTVYSRNRDNREAFARSLREKFSFEVVAAATVEAAVAEATITTLITNAQQPFLHAAALPRGAHINAVGAILPTHAEFATDVFARCDLIAVDSVANVRKNSREFIEYFGESPQIPVQSLASIIAAGTRRPAGVDLSLFKSIGMGISDLSIALEVFRRAEATGIGTRLGEAQKAEIRWQE